MFHGFISISTTIIRYSPPVAHHNPTAESHARSMPRSKTNALLAFGDLGPSLSSLSMTPLANAALIASAGNTHRRTNGLSRWKLVYL